MEEKTDGAGEALKEALVNFGVDSETAQEMVVRMGEYKAAATEGGLGGDGQGSFTEGEGVEIKLGDRGKPDLVKILAGTVKEDGLEKNIITSEIPSDMLMDIVLAMTLDQITKLDYKESPSETLLANFVLAMKAINRKMVKDMIQLYAVGEELKKEVQGPAGLTL